MALIRSCSNLVRIFLCVSMSYACLLTLISCTPEHNRPSPELEQPEEDYIYHRIKYQGETVAVISAWYTKSAKNWPEIVDSNPKMIPSKLRIGDLVRIPKRLVRRFQSLPQDFVVSFKSGVNQDSSKSNKSLPSPEESIDKASERADDFKVNQEDISADKEAGIKSKEKTDSRREEINSDVLVKETEPSAVLESKSVDQPIAEESSKKPEIENSNRPLEAPPANDENQKIRDQLMQELLQ